MTIEGVASMDVTTLFKSCMKTIRTRNKAMGVSLAPTKIFPTSSPSSAFNGRAKDIMANIYSHRKLLEEHKRKFLQDHEQSMTDHERNYMEKVVTTNLRIIDDNIKTLNLDQKSEGSKDASDCRESIILILRNNFGSVNSHFKEMKEKRKTRQKEKDNLFKLQRPAGLKKRPSSISEDSNKTPVLGRRRKSLGQETCDGSQPESWSQSSTDSQNSNQVNPEEPKSEMTKEESAKSSSKGNDQDYMTSPVEDERTNILGDMSSEERQMLEEENLHMYKDLMSNQEEVRQITRQVVELGNLQDFFTGEVDVQAHQIEEIHDTIMSATENITGGNEQVREAMRKDAGFRVWIMFFLIVMSCTILFLDWYNG